MVPIACEIPCPSAALLALGLWTARQDEKQGDGNTDIYRDKDRDNASR